MAEISEILSKEAIEGIKQADKYLAQLDATLLKAVDNGKKFDEAMRSQAATAKNIGEAQKKLKADAEALARAKQLEAKAAKETADAQRSLDRQRQAALAIMAKQEAKERELMAAIKMEVKSIADAEKQNRALIEVRKRLDLSTQQGKATLQTFNAQINQNTEFMRRNADAAKQQSMNIGNYGSALTSLFSRFAAMLSVTAIISFGRESWSAFEDSERAARRLFGALKEDKQAYGELYREAQRLQEETGISDEEISQIQMLGAAAGKSTEDIKKITQATIDWASLTGKDLQTAYLEINKSLSGTAGRLVRVDSAFGDLTEKQLKNGAAVDLILEKYKGLAKDTASQTDILKASWDEFKEAAGATLADVVNPALRETSNLLNEINKKQSFWQKFMTTLGYAVGPLGAGNAISTYYDAKNGTSPTATPKKSLPPIKPDDGDGDDKKNKSVTRIKTAYEKLTEAIDKYIEKVKSGQELTAADKTAFDALVAKKKAIDANVEALTKERDVYKEMQDELAKLIKKKTDLVVAGQAVPPSLEISIVEAEAKLKHIENLIKGVGQALTNGPSYGTAKLNLDGTMTPMTPTTKLTKRKVDYTGVNKSNDKDLQEWQKGQDDIRNAEIEAAQSVANATFEIIRNRDQAALDGKLNDLEREKDAKLKNTKLTEAQKQKIEEDYAKKEKKLRTDAAKKEKAAAIIQSIISGVLAVLKAGGLTTPTGVAAAIAAAAQTAVIVATPIPQFDAGTLSTPDTFIAGERRPEWMITPKGDVQLISKPTLFKGMAGSTVIGGADTERIMRASDGIRQETLAPYIADMKESIVQAIKTKSELHISASGSTITEREGDYYKTYFNRKVRWAGNRN